MRTETKGERRLIEAMRTRTRRIATLLALGIIVFLALGCAAMGVLYLWPGFDRLNVHLAGYLQHIFLALYFVWGVTFGAWATLVWYSRRRRLRT